ncbi:MAG TPA: hypothetical protein VNX29_01935 [Kaistia sp.]|nr:hypothetical protein [Kaistia sp.]
MLEFLWHAWVALWGVAFLIAALSQMLALRRSVRSRSGVPVTGFIVLAMTCVSAAATGAFILVRVSGWWPA